MNKSFLELLKAEDDAICGIESFKKSIIYFLNESENADNEKDRETCKRLVSDYENRVTKEEENLLQIRKELKNYIAYLKAL